jgi:hypothetical protein
MEEVKGHTSYAQVSKDIEWCIFNLDLSISIALASYLPLTINQAYHFANFFICAISTPKLPQPNQLHNLLREEKCTDEVRIRTECGKVLVMDVLHVRGTEESILLSCEVEEEGCWC